MKVLKLTAFLALSLTTLACGVSPILHHVQASPIHERTGAPTPRPNSPEDSRDCPLAFPKSGLCASFTWENTPSSEAENAAVLKFWDRSGSTAEGPFRSVDGDVAVSLWMPAMGHGSSPVSVSESEPGTYNATRIYFIMPGKWEIRVQIKKNHALVEQAVLPIEI